MRVLAGVCFIKAGSIGPCLISLRMALEKQRGTLGVFYYTKHPHSLEKSSPLFFFQFHWSFHLHQARWYCPCQWGQGCTKMDLLPLPLRIWSRSRQPLPWPCNCLPLSVCIPLWYYSGHFPDWVKSSLFCSAAVGDSTRFQGLWKILNTFSMCLGFSREISALTW